MNQMQRKLLLLLLAGLLVINLKAQISEGGLPPSFSLDRKSHIEAKDIPLAFVLEELRETDLLNEAERGTPPRIAENIPVDLSLHNSGLWTTLPDGSEIWRLRIRAQGALALILGYEDFFIPEGASLFLYNEERTQVLGAYTHKSHPEGGVFATEMLAGDDISLELLIPEGRPDLKDAARITISDIGYCYNHVQVLREDSKIGESSHCMINVNCSPEGDDWQTEKKGVVKMLMYLSGSSSIAPGWYHCSGTMINNTAQDMTPYLLSAFHCYSEGATPTDFLKWIFYFHYESDGCKTTDPSNTRSLTGCMMRTAIPIEYGSDGLLLELMTRVPEDWDVYFNGWNRCPEPVSGGGVGIHHPAGDVKKISTFDEYIIDTWPGSNKIPGADNAHWHLNYVATANGHSIAEGGSSGSPMFSSEHLVIGSMTGGSATCDFPTRSVMYGRLWYHWDQYGDSPDTQMKTWLDPINSGAETLNGIFFDPVAPRLALSEYTLNLKGEYNKVNPAQRVSITGYNLTEAIEASVENEFELSIDETAWSRSVQLPQAGGDLYVRYAPTVYGNHQGQIRFSNPALSYEYQIQLNASSCRNINLENENLPNGKVGYDYSAQLTATGSDGPYTYELVSGDLPLGLTFKNGLIEGNPQEAGFFSLKLMVTDKYDCSSNLTANMYVVCDVVSDYPYNEDFESGAIPLCWKENRAIGRVSWLFSNGVRPEYEEVTAAQSGNYNALFYDSSYDGNITHLFTPQLDLSSLSNPEMIFWYMMPSWGTDIDELSVFYKTSAHESWKLLTVLGEDTPAWTEVKVALPEPSSEYFVAFQGKSMYGYGIGLDNINILQGAVNIDTVDPDDLDFRFNNPVEGTLNLFWTDEVLSIRIYSVLGEKVFESDELKGRNSATIPASQWGRGIYLLDVKTNTQQRSYKIINK